MCWKRRQRRRRGGGGDVPSRATKMVPSSFIRASSTSTLVTPSRRPFVHFIGFAAPLDHCTPVVGVLITKYAVQQSQSSVSLHCDSSSLGVPAARRIRVK